jgi:hypothetical protein
MVRWKLRAISVVLRTVALVYGCGSQPAHMTPNQNQMPKDILSLERAMDLSDSIQEEEEQVLSQLMLQLLGTIEDSRTQLRAAPLVLMPLMPGSSSEPVNQVSSYFSDIIASTDISEVTVPVQQLSPFFQPTWEERIATSPPPSAIRLLDPPPADSRQPIEHLWERDYLLPEWHRMLTELDICDTLHLPDGSGGMCDISCTRASIYGPEYSTFIRNTFYNNQRKRWLAFKVINLWRQRVWRKRTQCNVDLIDMEPITDRDAIYVTDTCTRTVYKFHRNDIYKCLISNICMSDEMLPCPRPPTNPWTNAPLSLTQTISVCQQLITDYARKGRCPPVLFAAFCSAGYNVSRFLSENSSILSQYAISSYFKDITPHNIDTVTDTILQLLSSAGVNYSTVTVRRWIHQTPLTTLHREWLALVRDYTLYINLHIQARPSWYDEEFIYRDVRRLYSRTHMVDPAGPRIRLMRNMSRVPVVPSMPTPLASSIVGGSDISLSTLALLLGSQTQPLVLPTLPSMLAYFDLSGGGGGSSTR